MTLSSKDIQEGNLAGQGKRRSEGVHVHKEGELTGEKIIIKQKNLINGGRGHATAEKKGEVISLRKKNRGEESQGGWPERVAGEGLK